MILEEVIINALGKVKAHDILAYDMKGKSPFYDEMILSSVDSERQASAVISYISDDVEQAGFKIRSIEGSNTPWVLIDCYDIVVSIFTKEEREHFALEKIFMELPCRKLD